MEQQILEIFAKVSGSNADDLSFGTRLEEDLELKSIHKFTLLAMLEGAMGSAPDPDAAESMKTIQEFVDFYGV
jgi:acyl carrier protein